MYRKRYNINNDRKICIYNTLFFFTRTRQILYEYIKLHYITVKNKKKKKKKTKVCEPH